MRLIHTADWHLGRTLEGRSRLAEQADFLDELADIAAEEQADAILMAGDVFDTVNPPAAAEQLFYESAARLSDGGKRPLFFISGNHDNPDRLSAASPLAGKHGIHLFGLPDLQPFSTVIPSTGERINLALLPYPSEARLREMLSQENAEDILQKHYDRKIKAIFEKLGESFTDDAVNIAMSHIYVAGSSSSDSERPIEVGGAYTVSADSLPSGAQYTALGHLHRPQNIRKAKGPARYSGSPLAYSFSESGYAKSVTIVDVKPGSEAQVKEIPLSSGKPLVTWKAAEGLNQVYQWLDEGKDANSWIDLEIHLKNALSLEEIHRLRKLHNGFIHIRPVFETKAEEENRQAASSLPLDELFKRFYARQTGGAEPEHELTGLFMELVNEDELEGEE